MRREEDKLLVKMYKACPSMFAALCSRKEVEAENLARIGSDKKTTKVNGIIGAISTSQI